MWALILLKGQRVTALYWQYQRIDRRTGAVSHYSEVVIPNGKMVLDEIRHERH